MELTKEIAMRMYQLIKEFGSADLAFKNQESSEFEPEHFVILDKELKRLKNDFKKCFKSDLFILESDLLDVEIVLSDFKNEWKATVPIIKDADFQTILNETRRIITTAEFIRSGMLQIGVKDVQYEDAVIQEPVYLKPENIGDYVSNIDSEFINVKEFLKNEI